MKKLIILTLLLVSTKWSYAGTITTAFSPLGNIAFSSGAVAGGGGASGFSVIASTIASSSNGNSITTPAIDTTGAKLIVLGFTFFSGGSQTDPPTITDSKSNVWTALAVSSVTSNMASIIYYSTNPIVGSGHTFTESASNSFPTIAVLAVSGGLTPNVFDQQNGNNDNGGGSSIQTNPVTPSADSELIVTVLNNDGSTITNSINSSFIISNQIYPPNGNSYDTGLAYIINGAGTSGTPVNPTWSTPASFTQSTRIATFK